MALTRRQLLEAAGLAALATALPTVEALAAPRRLLNGTDLSWLPDVEQAGGRFYTASGKRLDAIALLRSYGARLGRVRVFVDAAGGNGDLARALRLARRLKNNKLQFCLDLHYSDTWADPGHQSPPAAWAADPSVTSVCDP